jgi:hypothetical protein
LQPDFDDDFDTKLAHRLRVTRIVLGITEKEAAAAAHRDLRTWRKYETTGKGRIDFPVVLFCQRYDVSLNWLICGDPSKVRAHLAKRARGKIAILNAKGRLYRAAANGRRS